MDRLILFAQFAVIWAVSCILIGMAAKVTWRVMSIGWGLV